MSQMFAKLVFTLQFKTDKLFTQLIMTNIYNKTIKRLEWLPPIDFYDVPHQLKM